MFITVTLMHICGVGVGGGYASLGAGHGCGSVIPSQLMFTENLLCVCDILRGHTRSWFGTVRVRQ